MSRLLRKKVSATELEVLKLLWELSEATIRELTECMYGQCSDPQYSTVQKLLDRLESKGYVLRDRSTRAHRFRARISREEFLGGRLRDLAEELCEGSLAPLVSTLLQTGGISTRDREDLNRYLSQLETEGDADDGEAGS